MIQHRQKIVVMTAVHKTRKDKRREIKNQTKWKVVQKMRLKTIVQISKYFLN